MPFALIAFSIITPSYCNIGVAVAGFADHFITFIKIITRVR